MFTGVVAGCTVLGVRSWATWFLFTGVPARYVALRVRSPEPLSSCSAVCPLAVLLCVGGVLGHLAPVHRCARFFLLFFCCGVLGHLAPAHRCARLVCCAVCAVSWATWLLFTGVLTLCAVFRLPSWATWFLFSRLLAQCVVLSVACAVLRVWGVAAGRTLVHPDSGCS